MAFEGIKGLFGGGVKITQTMRAQDVLSNLLTDTAAIDRLAGMSSQERRRRVGELRGLEAFQGIKNAQSQLDEFQSAVELRASELVKQQAKPIERPSFREQLAQPQSRLFS